MLKGEMVTQSKTYLGINYSKVIMLATLCPSRLCKYIWLEIYHFVTIYTVIATAIPREVDQGWRRFFPNLSAPGSQIQRPASI